MTSSTVDEALSRLHHDGWSIGDIAVLEPSGWIWVVSGTKGIHRIIAKARTQSEAWDHALHLAEDVD